MIGQIISHYKIIEKLGEGRIDISLSGKREIKKIT